MSVRVNLLQDGMRELQQSPEVAEELGRIAAGIAGRVSAPSAYRIGSRHGVGPRGAFAQVQMFGPGAIAYEFGTRTRPAYSPLRRALHGGAS